MCQLIIVCTSKFLAMICCLLCYSAIHFFYSNATSVHTHNLEFQPSVALDVTRGFFLKFIVFSLSAFTCNQFYFGRYSLYVDCACFLFSRTVHVPGF